MSVNRVDPSPKVLEMFPNASYVLASEEEATVYGANDERLGSFVADNTFPKIDIDKLRNNGSQTA